MMYYCPCPCLDPVDTDPEENTFLALPRKLSYVQDSYLDAHSVSGSFVFNAHTDRRLAANTFSHDLNDYGIWRGADATQADVDGEGEESKCEGEESSSLLSVVKSQEFPISFGWDISSLSSSSSSTVKLTHQSVNGNSCHHTNVGAAKSSSFSSSSSAVLEITPPQPQLSSSPSSNTTKTPSFISRVTSLISPPKEGVGLVKTDNYDLGSSVDAELTPNPSPEQPGSSHPELTPSFSPCQPGGPSPSVLRSPDRSGLIMDRGEDLVIPTHDSHATYATPTTAAMDDFVSAHGPEAMTDEDPVDSQDDTLPDPVTRDDESPEQVANKSSSSSNSCKLDLEKCEQSSNAIFPTTSSVPRLSCESPDSDAFSEEGVFVNMLDDTDVNDKSTTSEVSDDTNMSVDSMFWSPGEEYDAGGLEEQKVPRRMSLEEAISKAASDFNRMTMMIYPETRLTLQEDEDLPGTSKGSRFVSRGSPLRGLHGLSVIISDNTDTSGSNDPQNSAPKESPIYEDNEFNFNKHGLRKSSSLKTNKTPPGTPHRKKVVRFADAMGLDLESVRHVLNMESPPKIPASAMADLKQGLTDDRRGVGTRYLTSCFSQPGASDDFVQTVLAQKVRLENAIVTDLTITGFIRVANVAFHKSVRVRYTHNNWATFHDIAASYIPNSCDGPTDRFSFSIVAPAYFVPGNRLEFAVSYNAEGTEFWDSNSGLNYGFECFARTLPTENESGWIHFL